MARTIRPKIHHLLPRFLTPFPEMQPHPFIWEGCEQHPDFTILPGLLRADKGVAPISSIRPGETAAALILAEFLDRRLKDYGLRNDPNLEVCSNLSPYLHFGMISAQRIVLEIQKRGDAGKNVDSFLDELVVRRELAENFCLYCQEYDSESSFPEWARQSLARHLADRRPFLYPEEVLERGDTHDRLWNAAQRQMLVTGKMHGYMRMYWAKKILEWTENPAQALRIAIRLNDRYSLDGRDSNGYAGIAWSIGGLHDRGWPERPVFGKIRYMNDRGMARKFDIERYIRSWTLEEE
jgi:deoxyribodipyrimidine photo-lyase